MIFHWFASQSLYYFVVLMFDLVRIICSCIQKQLYRFCESETFINDFTVLRSFYTPTTCLSFSYNLYHWTNTFVEHSLPPYRGYSLWTMIRRLLTLMYLYLLALHQLVIKTIFRADYTRNNNCCISRLCIWFVHSDVLSCNRGCRCLKYYHYHDFGCVIRNSMP